MIVPKPEQAEVTYFADLPYPGYKGSAFHVVIYGMVGMGKTLFGLRQFIAWTMLHFSGVKFFVGAKTQQILDAELKEITAMFLEELGMLEHARLRSKNWSIPTFAGKESNTFLTFVFGEGESPAKRIQGTNAQGSFVDEANNMQASLRRELNRRTRMPGAKMVWTLNPWDDEFKQEFVDRILDDEIPGVVRLMPAISHPGVPDDYLEQQRALCGSDAEIKVFIEGEWAAPGDVIYVNVGRNNFSDMPDSAVVDKYIVGVDWGSETVTHAVLIAVAGSDYYVIDEWRHDRQKQGSLDDKELAERLLAAFSYVDVSTWRIDKRSGGLRFQLDILGVRAVLAEGNPGSVDQGIQKLKVLFYSKRLFIGRKCVELRKELRKYRRKDYSDKDRPVAPKVVKRNDHGCDALRYGLEKVQVDTVMSMKRKVAA